MSHPLIPACATDNSLQNEEGKRIDQYIGSRIQAVRRAKNISQKALLRQVATPLSQQQLSRYEQGASSIPSKLLFEISAALGVTTETFMPLNTGLAEKTGLPMPQLENAVEAALASFGHSASVSPEELQQLEKLLKHFYKR